MFSSRKCPSGKRKLFYFLVILRGVSKRKFLVFMCFISHKCFFSTHWEAMSYCSSSIQRRRKPDQSVISLLTLKISQSDDKCHVNVPQEFFVILWEKKCFSLMEPTSSPPPPHQCPLFIVRGKISPSLGVIGLSPCFLQQQRSAGACNQAASSELWSPLRGL